MADEQPRILFVPVSGPFGLGELARSSTIAAAVRARWPEAGVHFLVSRRAPAAGQLPFATTLLPSSPTFHTHAVIDRIRAWRPDIVIFDNAGRSAQLRAARKLGARIVYISSRRRQRRKAFRLSWMGMLDEHWIAYPRFVAGDLGSVERLKLKLLGRPALRYLDVMMAGGGADGDAGGLPAQDVLIIPGGGTGHPGAEHVIGEFRRAARELADRGFALTYVGPTAGAAPGSSAAASGAGNRFAALGALPQAELVRRMRRARLVIVNGGSTLLQAIACGVACVAVPIAGDQQQRIERCARAGVAVAAAPRAADIADKALSLLEHEEARASLARRAGELALSDGVAVALEAIARLLERGR